MNSNDITQLSTALSSQRVNTQRQVAVVKLANDNMELQGQAALQLIQSLPQPVGNLGNNINIKV